MFETRNDSKFDKNYVRRNLREVHEHENTEEEKEARCMYKDEQHCKSYYKRLMTDET